MKKCFAMMAVAAMMLCGTAAVTTVAHAEGEPFPATQSSNWELTRTTFEQTDKGLEFRQTEMGTPDNHAIAILKVPFEGTASFEIKLRFTMSDFESGRNDVWSGIGIMGVPKFINWAGNQAETPGIFTRFMSYSGDLSCTSDIYQKDYHLTGRDDPNSEVRDTWTLVGNTSAGVGVGDEITFRLSWDEKDGKSFYNLYLNGECITSAGEAAFIDREVVFPDNCIYLVLAMNTQDDPFNDLSKIVVTSINGVSCASGNNSGTNGDPSGNNGEESGGCGSVIGIGGLTVGGSALLLLAVCLLMRKKGDKTS